MKEIYKFLLHARNKLRHLKCILIWSLQQLHETGSIPDLIQTLRLRGIHKTNDKLDPSNGPLSFSSHFVSCRQYPPFPAHHQWNGNRWLSRLSHQVSKELNGQPGILFLSSAKSQVKTWTLPVGSYNLVQNKTKQQQQGTCESIRD